MLIRHTASKVITGVLLEVYGPVALILHHLLLLLLLLLLLHHVAAHSSHLLLLHLRLGHIFI